jgi:hemolysin III
MIESQVRQQSQQEEWANSLSHGVGLIGALALLPYMVMAASRHGDSLTSIGALIFGLTLVLLYASSTAYHMVSSFRKDRAKFVLQKIDHMAVYFLIAGTYTPFTLDVLRGALGWSLFALIWLLATLGTVLYYRGLLKKQAYSCAYYLLMGWLVIVVVVPLWSRISKAALLALFGGGVCYSVGVYFYASYRRRYAHFIWHLFVLAGTILHVGAVLGVYSGA